MPERLQDMQLIVAELSSRDETMAAVINRHRLCPLGQRQVSVTHFESLVESVVSQQLSVKAADTIYRRLVAIAGDEVTPARFVEISEEHMRAAGISAAKYKTINGLAEAHVTGRIDVNNLHEIDDDDVITDQLTKLWGIGSWTVDMFMMHQLGRLDVWPTGDLGVRRGWQKIYALDEPVSPKGLGALGEKFAPYRSVIAWYCWQDADS